MLAARDISSSRDAVTQRTCAGDNPATRRDLCWQAGSESKDLSKKLLRSARGREFTGCSRFSGRRWETRRDLVPDRLFTSNARKVGLAFNIVQKFEFDSVDYSYDRSADVLDISFGAPAPSVALQVEDWLAMRVSATPPYFQGMTIVGFRKIFQKINGYVEQELPKRMKRLANTSIRISFSYDDQSDALIVRLTEQLFGWHGFVERLFRRTRPGPSIFERLSSHPEDSLRNVYVEKTLPSKQIVGVKILEFTKTGPAAIEGIFGAMIDSIFEPKADHDENAHLIANALISKLDWPRLGRLVAS